MNKCSGCGATLQTKNPELEGFTRKEDSTLCERCFRINNYGDYKVVIKDNNEFVNILKNINDTKDLVVLVVDIFNINEELIEVSRMLDNPILLVLSKRDIMPKSIYEQKILNYMDRFKFNYVDKIIVSSFKNYQFDDLYNKIKEYKRSNNVFVVGFTNAGKSTLINKLLYNYSDNKTKITTSILPSTTLDTMKIAMDPELTIIDTPGLLDNGNIINYVNGNDLKKIVPNKEIKPITFQIKNKQVVELGKYAYIECLGQTNMTLFVSNKLDIKRIYNSFNNEKFSTYELEVNNKQDIVIVGLGFIKVSKKCKFKIHVIENVLVYVRDSLI